MLYNSLYWFAFFFKLYFGSKNQKQNSSAYQYKLVRYLCMCCLHYSFSNNGKVLVIYNNGKFLILNFFFVSAVAIPHIFCFFLSFAHQKWTIFKYNNIFCLSVFLVQFNFKFIKVQYSSVWFGLVWFDSI